MLAGRTWEIEVGSTTELNEWMETFSILALLSRCTTFVEKEVRRMLDPSALLGPFHFLVLVLLRTCARSAELPFTDRDPCLQVHTTPLVRSVLPNSGQMHAWRAPDCHAAFRADLVSGAAELVRLVCKLGGEVRSASPMKRPVSPRKDAHPKPAGSAPSVTELFTCVPSCAVKQG